VQVAVLPHSSVAWYVLVVVSKQLTVFTASPTNVTVEVPQPSEVVTIVISGFGIIALQPVNASAGGQLIIGGVIS